MTMPNLIAGAVAGWTAEFTEKLQLALRRRSVAARLWER